MARLEMEARAGACPFLAHHFDHVAGKLSMVNHSSNAWMLDPCAHEGVFARHLADHLRLKLATMEVNEETAVETERVSNHHVTGDALKSECGTGQFSFIWSNPPFMADTEARLEWRFLKRFQDALAPGGVLAYTIPGATMMQHGNILAHLSRFYRDHYLGWLPEPNDYKQILYIGRRRELANDENLGLADMMNVLTSGVGHTESRVYRINPVKVEKLRLRSHEIDWKALRSEGQSFGIKMEDYFDLDHSVERTDLILPMRLGHLTSALGGGGLDDAELDNLYLKGSIHQYQVEEKTEEKGVEALTRTQYEGQFVTYNSETFEAISYRGASLSSFIVDRLDTLVELLGNKYKPRYNFDVSEVPNWVLRIVNHAATTRDALPGQEPGLSPGQKHVAIAILLALETETRFVFASCQMGWGKSLLAAVMFALNHRAVGCKPHWFVTEPHLVDQMIEEVKLTWPMCHVTAIKSIEDARYMIRYWEHLSDTQRLHSPVVGIIGKETFKHGTGASWACVPHLVGKGDEQATVWRCPDCGRVQVVQTQRDPRQGFAIYDDEYKGHIGRFCCYEIANEEDGKEMIGCGGALWQFDRTIGGSKGSGQHSSIPHRIAKYVHGRCLPVALESDEDYNLAENGQRMARRKRYKSRPGKVRWPLIQWLTKRHADKVGMVVVDEVHGYSGESTDAGYALAELCSVADRGMFMTGTLMNGYSSSLFFLLHRIDPDFRKHYKYDDKQRFVERYGVLEKKTKVSEYTDYSKGSGTLRTRRQTYVSELPGVSPELVLRFLGFSVFSTLEDLGIPLPAETRRLVTVDMLSGQSKNYDNMEAEAIEAMKELKGQTNEEGRQISIAGSYLYAMRGYATGVWREEQVTDKDGVVYAEAPPIEGECTEMELRLVQELLAQKERGRRVVVFVDQTRTRDIVNPRLMPLAEEAGLTAIFCDTDAQSRGAWIKRNAPFSDVMFVNPRGVKTGFNLIEFATAIFYEIPYELIVFEQAAARPRRPTQTKSVEVIYMATTGTITERALDLMFEKTMALNVFAGNAADEMLEARVSSGGFMTELLQRAMDGKEVESLESNFQKYTESRQGTEGGEYAKGFGSGPILARAMGVTSKVKPVVLKVEEVRQVSLF